MSAVRSFPFAPTTLPCVAEAASPGFANDPERFSDDTLRDLPAPPSTGRRRAAEPEVASWSPPSAQTARLRVVPATNPAPSAVASVASHAALDEIATPLLRTRTGDPDWVAVTWRAIRREARLYVKTAWAFTIRPGQTAAAWAKGEFRGLNPLAYLLNTVAIMGPWRALWQRILHVPDMPLYMDVLNATTPFFGVLMAGSLHHALFRACGSKRSLQSSWAISIYSTGGLPVILGLLTTPVQVRAVALSLAFQQRPRGAQPAELAHEVWSAFGLTWVLGLVGGVVVLAMQNSALAGLHAMSRRRTAGIQLATTFLPSLAIALSAGPIVFLWGLLLVFLKHRLH